MGAIRNLLTSLRPKNGAHNAWDDSDKPIISVGHSAGDKGGGGSASIEP